MAKGQPAFYQFAFHLDQVEDTFLDMTGFGKGIVLVNGHHIGRFWEVGPTLSLYIPHGFLKDGKMRSSSLRQRALGRRP